VRRPQLASSVVRARGIRTDCLKVSQNYRVTLGPKLTRDESMRDKFSHMRGRLCLSPNSPHSPLQRFISRRWIERKPVPRHSPPRKDYSGLGNSGKLRTAVTPVSTLQHQSLGTGHTSSPPTYLLQKTPGLTDGTMFAWQWRKNAFVLPVWKYRERYNKLSATLVKEESEARQLKTYPASYIHRSRALPDVRSARHSALMAAIKSFVGFRLMSLVAVSF
jgi:hypothetical protein